ncbi:MAG: cache domain-containing protein [Chloroflexota bacterium]|nr:cache domain-containing protein [Chloroflexota bacterium]
MTRALGDYLRMGAVTLAALAALVATAACVDISIGTSDNPSPVTEPGAYTKFFVHQAIERYDDDGLEETVAYYNTAESVDGDWYVFIADEDRVLIAHAPIPENVGKPLSSDDFKGADGFHFGNALAEASSGGDWVTYTYLNPNSGDEEQKHSWVVEKDGLIFGSGWYQR